MSKSVSSLEYNPNSSTTRDVSKVSRPKTSNTSRPGTSISAGSANTRNFMCLGEYNVKQKIIGACVMSEGNGIQLHMSEFTDNLTFSRTLQQINLFQPEELVLPSKSAEIDYAYLIETVQQKFPYIKLVPAHHQAYDQDEGLALLKRFANDSNMVSALLVDKVYAQAALSALFRYSVSNAASIRPNSVNVKYHNLQKTLLIDFHSAYYLELVANTIDGGSKNSMIGLFESISTKMGYRLLRYNILQPSTDQQLLEGWQSSIEALKSNPPLVNQLQSILKQFPDLDSLQCYFSGLQLHDGSVQQGPLQRSLELYYSLRLCEQIGQLLLQGVSNPLIMQLAQDLHSADVKNVVSQIERVIIFDTGINTNVKLSYSQKLHCIQAGPDSLLHRMRLQYEAVTARIQEVFKMYQSQFENDFELKLQFNAAKGQYFLSSQSPCVMSRNGKSNLPGIFTNVVQKKKSLVEITTMEMTRLNVKLVNIVNEIYGQSNAKLKLLVETISEHLGVLYKVSESVAQLDYLLSLAQYALIAPYAVCPSFGGLLSINEGYHPIKSKCQVGVIPNDIFAFPGGNFQLITGINMSGKSTYLRQVALLVIMAHMGSFIPCKQASIPIFKSVFTRLGFVDEPESNLSTFMTEMRDMAYILDNVGDESLIIIDELGRGTSQTDGLSLSFAMSEYLLQSKCTTFFVTHFAELAHMLEIYSNVVNLHLQVEADDQAGAQTEVSDSSVRYTYSVHAGSNEVTSYGIKLARMEQFPPGVIDMAQVVSDQVSKQLQYLKQCSKATKGSRRNIANKLASHLQNIQKSNLYSQEELIQHLKELRVDLITQMKKQG
ncbi:hypothetical protein MP228_008662 [Amoeboaphelidium protococcarum]|nr:hypothetical protein MP228_008662 [Amoeboaphelidium protococcarum]